MQIKSVHKLHVNPVRKRKAKHIPQVVQFAGKSGNTTKNGLLLQSVKVEILCDAVDSLRRNGIFVGGYSKATLWHTLNLRSAAVFPP